MSDNPIVKDFEDKLAERVAREEALEKNKKEVQEIELTLRRQRALAQIKMLNQSQDELSRAKLTSFSASSEDEIAEVVKQNREYMEAARHSMKFICSDFKKVVPYFRKNLLLICGKTGEGKSTTVANIVFNTILQINPVTGLLRKVLIITNEERTEDCYNRITCLIKGWRYANHDEFTEEQRATFEEMIPKLARGGRLKVVDNNYNGIPGMTTSIEGICTIFDNLIRDKEYYDAVIIDYYQNVKYSKEDPTLAEWQVQQKLAGALDQYKNVYPAPIIVMAQANPPDEAGTPIEYRIKGRKVITDPATLIMEMVADRENLRTEWVVHKSRFTGSIGQSFYTGFDSGKFVPYNTEFMQKVNRYKEEQQAREVYKHFEEKKEEKNADVPNETSSN